MTRPRRIRPKRLTISVAGTGARRVELSCSCVTVSRTVSLNEEVRQVMSEIDREHRQRAPLCRHGDPLGLAMLAGWARR